MSASVRARPIGNSVERDCITKCKEQIHNVIELPACLPKLVKAEVIAEATGWSPKHVYRLAQQGRIPHHCLEGSIRFDPRKIAIWIQSREIPAHSHADAGPYGIQLIAPRAYSDSEREMVLASESVLLQLSRDGGAGQGGGV
jgi:predicted DNA-binding transcriptional regulator AlpA